MKVYLTLGEELADGKKRVKGWGSTRGSSQDVEIEIDEYYHDFFSNPFVFTLANGQLEKDETYAGELANRPKPKTGIEMLGEEIVKLKLEISKLKGGVL